MASSFIPIDSDSNLCYGDFAFVLLVLSFVFLFFTFLFESGTFGLIFLIIIILAIIYANKGLSINSQRSISIVTLLLSIIAFICLTYYILSFFSSIGYHPVEKSTFRSEAKEIQSALDCYYNKWGSFPDKNNLNKAFNDMNWAIPIYKNGKPMIKTYKKINDDNYVITFNYYDGGYFEVKNCKLKKNTDTNQLLK